MSVSISNSARLHLCLSLPVNQFTPHRFSLLGSILPSKFLAQPSVSFSRSLLLFCEHPFDVGVHRTAHTRFYFYAMRGALCREVGDSRGGVNEDEDCHSPHLSPSLSIISRWTIWMKMRSTFSDKPRTDSPVGAFGRSTRKGRDKQSSTPWIRTLQESRP